MAVSAPLVFKQAAAERALERQLVTVDLLVSLQVAEAAESGQNQVLFQLLANINLNTETKCSHLIWKTS